MNSRFTLQRLVALAFMLTVWGGAIVLQAQKDKEFQSTFSVDKRNLGTRGSNPFFNLTPGFQLSYRHDKETELVTVLNETKRIDGVDARVVEDREMDASGKLVELTRDYYAIDAITNDVYYMGEEVDEYDKSGKVKGHEGSWLSGVNGASFGLMMPASPRTGQKFYQEQAKGVAMDRVEIASVSQSIAVPAGHFTKVVHAVETSPLEGGKAHKWYVSGIGPVKDDAMELEKYGMK